MAVTGNQRRKQRDEEIALVVLFDALPDGQHRCGFSASRLAHAMGWQAGRLRSAVRRLIQRESIMLVAEDHDWLLVERQVRFRVRMFG